MTETSEILKAKIEAVQAMAEAFNVASVGMAGLNEAKGWIKTWAAAVSALAPAEAVEAVTPTVPLDSEPPVGATVTDRDGDFWTRAPEGDWVHNYSPDEHRAGDGWNWERLDRRYGPMVLRNL